jgi:rubrerythrin
MTVNMSPALQQRVQPLVQKWDGFLAKVGARIEEVRAEADAGLDQLIQQHAMDHGPMGAAFTALQSRFHGLSDKVDEAWEKIDEEFDDVRDQSGLSESDYDALSQVWDGMYEKFRAMQQGLERTHYTVEMKKNADWARQLRGLAEREMAAGVQCSQCGTPMQILDYTKASQQACPSCNAVNDVMPGSASAMFFMGLGAHALAHEAAWNEWVGEQDAKDAFDRYRHPTAYDEWVYLNAARTYWTKYYQVAQQIAPASCPDINAAVEGRMGHYTVWTQEVDKQKHGFLGQLVDASTKGDAATIQQLLSNRPHHVDLSDCAECLVERRQYQGATVVLDFQYHADGEDDPKGAWIREQLADIKKTVS